MNVDKCKAVCLLGSGVGGGQSRCRLRDAGADGKKRQKMNYSPSSLVSRGLSAVPAKIDRGSNGLAATYATATTVSIMNVACSARHQSNGK